jgi:phospholipid/cholesterol/gamma-HCH transport system substrate-binding protein
LSRRIELRVGILVVVAIFMTTFWLLFLKEFKFKTATFPVGVSFQDVSGITEGAEVRILGVTKGKVDKVELRRNDVILILAIEEGTFISDDAGFYLQSDLVNPATIRIEQGSSGKALIAGDAVTGRESGGIAILMKQSTELISSLQRIAEHFDRLMADGRIDLLLGEFESSSRELRLMVDESRGKTSSILDRVDSLAVSLHAIASENREPMAAAIANVSSFAVHADSLTSQLAALTESLATISNQLESGEGSLGKAIADDQLYLSVTSTVASLDSLIAAIKENPKDFVSFSIF